MTLWSNTELLSMVAKVSASTAVILAILSAAAGAIRLTVGHRLETLAAELKETAPIVDATLLRIPGGPLEVILFAANRVPFEAHWQIHLEGSSGSSFASYSKTVYPGGDTSPYHFIRALNPTLMPGMEGVIILDLQFKSIYSAEKHDPPHLGGQMTRRYRLRPDGQLEKIE